MALDRASGEPHTAVVGAAGRVAGAERAAPLGGPECLAAAPNPDYAHGVPVLRQLGARDGHSLAGDAAIELRRAVGEAHDDRSMNAVRPHAVRLAHRQGRGRMGGRREYEQGERRDQG